MKAIAFLVMHADEDDTRCIDLVLLMDILMCMTVKRMERIQYRIV